MGRERLREPVPATEIDKKDPDSRLPECRGPKGALLPRLGSGTGIVILAAFGLGKTYYTLESVTSPGINPNLDNLRSVVCEGYWICGLLEAY
jgi:hypothetical protein